MSKTKDEPAKKNGKEPTDELLTVKQAAKYLVISENILRLTIRCGKIPAQGRGKLMRVRKSDLLPFTDPLAAAHARRAASEDQQLRWKFYTDQEKLSA